MSEAAPRPRVRRATADDATAVATLLHDFNVEFDDPTPPVPALAERVRVLLDSGADVALVAGDGPDGPDGVAVLRFRPAIWSEALECYLAELYVRPARRGQGLGRALLEETLRQARAQGADRIELGTSEDDVVARALYERLGFTNRERLPDGPIMYVYEREL